MSNQTNTTDWQSARNEGRRLIELRDFETAANVLANAVTEDNSGESDALLGVARFGLEDYGAAAESFENALKRDPSQGAWKAQLQLSLDNAEAEVEVHVPDVRYFERDRLLEKPVIDAGGLPAEPPPPPPDSDIERLRMAVGNALGAAATTIMEVATSSVGTAAGYRDAVWTNWYRRGLVGGILTLAYMRNRLNSLNLLSTYPRGRLVGFQSAGQQPPPGVTHFRTANGSWNNLANPMEGAAGTRFPRNVRSHAAHPEADDELLSPNPREVSRKLLTRGAEMKEVPFLNMLAAAWINFENHDWISHGENLAREIIEIPLADDDPARLRFHQRSLLVGRTQADPTRLAAGDPMPVSFINEVTHWWDGSQIYGSDQATQDQLRTHVDGKMRLNADGTLPRDNHNVELTGFRRNWWVGLAMMHSLFVAEHNAICDMLKHHHADWDDNRLFNVARLINAAVMAKIHSVEWTPAILPNRVLSDGLHANWYGLLTNLLHSGNKRTLSKINVRNPEMGGVVGNPIDKHGSPFGLTEEFVEVYRLHSLLPERLRLCSLSSGDVIEELPFPRSRHAGSAKLTGRLPLADLFYSFGNQQPGQLVLQNFPRFMQELSVPGNPLFDLGAVDILRARERGVPRYNEFRRQLGLNPIRSVEDLTDDPEHRARIKEVYGDRPEDVERIDLMVGTLAETTRPTGFGFGETLFQIFILNATRRLQADRFYTDCYTEEYYTPEGLAWIDDADLKHVLLRHHPSLAGTGLANVKNAFEPWDTDARLSPSRHPLRGFDRALRPDPWRGDAS